MFTATNLTFPAGSAIADTQCVDVSIIDDVAVENAEEFYLQLSTSDASVVELSYICNRARFAIYDSDGEIMSH